MQSVFFSVGFSSSGRFAELRQKLAGPLLAECERASQLASDEEPVCQVAQAAEGELVLDVIAEQGARGAVARLWADGVAVVPISEWAAELAVAEAIVPGEARNLCLPRETNRREGDGTEADGEASTGASGDIRGGGRV